MIHFLRRFFSLKVELFPLSERAIKPWADEMLLGYASRHVIVVLNIAAKAAGTIIHFAHPPIDSVYMRIKFWAKVTPDPVSISSPVPYIVYAPRIRKKIAVRTVMKYPRLKSNSASFNVAVWFVSLDLENIHSDGHIQSSTGPGIQPMRGIRKPRFERVQGDGVLFKNEILITPAGPLKSKDITAKNVNTVSKKTRN